MRTLIAILIALFFMSCKPQYFTKYKVETPSRNYYANKITYINDSIMLHENDRKGYPKRAYIIPFRDANVIEHR